MRVQLLTFVTDELDSILAGLFQFKNITYLIILLPLLCFSHSSLLSLSFLSVLSLSHTHSPCLSLSLPLSV